MHKPVRTPWVHPTKLLWVPVIVLLVSAISIFGTPHVLWNYRYTGSQESKYYLSCDYLGRDSQRVVPTNGECPFMLFLKAKGTR